MNTHNTAKFRRLGRNTLFVASLFAAVMQAQARPVLPLSFGPPETSTYDQPTDTRIWRYVPIGPRGTYRPVVRIVAKPSAPPREVVRWVGPRGTVPIYREEAPVLSPQHWAGPRHAAPIDRNDS